MDIKSISIQMPIKDNILYFNDDIDAVSVSDFIKQYIEKCRIIIQDKKIAEDNISKILEEYNIANNPLNKPVKPITLPTPSLNIMINSPGGIVYDGFSLYDTIKSYNKAVTTNVYISGACMSMATIVMLGVPKEQRIAHPNTTFMVHQVSGIAFGTVSDLEEITEEAKRLNKRLFDIYEKETDITKEKLQEIYDAKRDWFMTADEALKYGLIGKISEVPIIL